MNIILNKYIPETLKKPVSSVFERASITLDLKKLKKTQNKYLNTFENEHQPDEFSGN